MSLKADKLSFFFIVFLLLFAYGCFYQMNKDFKEQERKRLEYLKAVSSLEITEGGWIKIDDYIINPSTINGFSEPKTIEGNTNWVHIQFRDLGGLGYKDIHFKSDEDYNKFRSAVLNYKGGK